jgi:hypothetical protein
MEKRNKFVLPEKDVFESYCVFSYIANEQLKERVTSYPYARKYALDIKKWLKQKTNWSDLKVRMGVENAESIIEIGKELVADDL